MTTQICNKVEWSWTFKKKDRKSESPIFEKMNSAFEHYLNEALRRSMPTNKK